MDAGERARRAWAAIWPKLAAVALVWVVWELIHLTGWKKFVLPGPGVTLSNLWEQAKTGLLWHAIGDTLERAVVGYAVALVIGSVVGLLVARVPPVRAAIGSLITGLQTLPSAAWIPFAIILFGLNFSAILFIIVMASAPAIANGVIAGVDYIPPLLLRSGKMIGLRGLGLTWHLVMPAALPTFVAGMKQAWAFTWHALLTAELLVIVAGRALDRRAVPGRPGPDGHAVHDRDHDRDPRPRHPRRRARSAWRTGRSGSAGGLRNVSSGLVRKFAVPYR